MQPRVSFAPMKRTIALVPLFLIAAIGAAIAQPAGGPNARQPPPPPAPAPQPSPPPPPEARLQIGQPAPVWDSRGWVLLGEQTVSGRVDRDSIFVGRYEGRFNKVNVVVLDSDLELQDFKIVFGDRTEYNPRVAQFFRENSRTRVIELPPSEQIINRIDFKYRNLPGGGRARVQVWGFKVGDVAQPPPSRPPVVNWDSTGWTKLGEREVNGRVDSDRIEVGRYEGRFSKLTIVVRDSDLEMIDFAVKFGRGPEWRPGITQYFRENQRTRVIDFPGDDRTIKHIDVRYRNIPGGGRARIEVWGLRSDTTAQPQPGRVWDDRGWTMLGERTVNGRRGADRDRIDVGRREGRFRKLTVVVLDSSLDMEDMEIRFGRGENFRPDVRQVFNEGSRTRVIDLPGDDRVIKWIEFRYRNLPGGGRARVQVWAK